jgi:hypothetical protein
MDELKMKAILPFPDNYLPIIFQNHSDISCICIYGVLCNT